MAAPSPGLLKLNTKAGKNLRRSRGGGRGLPKKGGQGGVIVHFIGLDGKMDKKGDLAGVQMVMSMLGQEG